MKWRGILTRPAGLLKYSAILPIKMSNKWFNIQMRSFTYISNHKCSEKSENLKYLCVVQAHSWSSLWKTFSVSFTWAFDSHKIMVIDWALNTLMFIKISEYWSQSAKTKEPFWILSRTKACVLIWSSLWKSLVLEKNRDKFLHSWYIIWQLNWSKWAYVLSLLVSFTFNSHSLFSWLNSS